MIIFAIPLRAKETCKDWDKCVQHFNSTLSSIFNQTNDSFRCIVACNERPPLLTEYDERLEFIEMSLPIPTEWITMARDKFWKLTRISVRIREILESQDNPEAGIYVMPVDADDLLSNKIAAHCAQYPNENGFVSRDGYFWNQNESFFRKYPEMHTFCGSCNIIKMFRNDLPDQLPAPVELCHDRETAKKLNARYPIRFDHNIVVDHYRSIGRPFSYLPFRSTVYVRETGDNISSLAHSQVKISRRFHPIAFLRSINIFQIQLITPKIKKEFGMD